MFRTPVLYFYTDVSCTDLIARLTSTCIPRARAIIITRSFAITRALLAARTSARRSPSFGSSPASPSSSNRRRLAAAACSHRGVMSSTTLKPAPDVHIDRAAFETSMTVRALRVPVEKTDAVLRALRGFALDVPRVKAVVRDPSEGRERERLVLLNDRVVDDSLQGVPEDKLSAVKAHVETFDMTTYEVPLTYEYFNAAQALSKLLPPGVEIPSSFETIGHVAHMNLRDEHAEYKYLIGKVVLDKNERLKTVVNKVGSIESEFRVPEWELLAGDPSLVTEVKQHGMTFKLDFGTVYWNSRLETEHKRLVDSFADTDVICDATSGVGPFSVPAAQRGIRCFASDLNPDCSKYLKINAQENRVKNLVKCYNMDARVFIKALLSPLASDDVDHEKAWVAHKAAHDAALSEFNAKKREAKEKKTPFRETKPKLVWAAAEDDGEPPAGSTFDHLITNLPASGIEFLDCLKGSFDRKVWAGRDLPMIHTYTFKAATETDDDVVRRGSGHLGAEITNATVSEVRDVSPNKLMVLLSFRITPDVAFPSENEETDAKRQRAN